MSNCAQDIPSAYCTNYYKLLGAYVRLRAERTRSTVKEAAAFDRLVKHRQSCPECQEHMRAMTAYAEQIDPWHMPDILDDYLAQVSEKSET